MHRTEHDSANVEAPTTYEVTLGALRTSLLRPARLPMPGDVFVLMTQVSTLAKVSYVVGDRFEVMERTGFMPHRRLSTLGNLIVRCKHFKSVWTEFDDLVARGFLVLESSPEVNGP